MANKQLVQYVEEAKSRGMDEAAIRAELVKSGWSAEDIDGALSLKAPAAPGAHLSAPAAPRAGMWVMFQYAVCFVCLYIVSFAFGSILDALIDKWLPSAAQLSEYYYSSGLQIQLQLASLIVAGPIFIILFIVLRRQVTKNPSIRSLVLRKVAIYFTLFVAACTVIGDLIWSIYDILDGNFSYNGFGHLLVIILIAGSIFMYLLRDVKEDRALLS